ncbi:MAG: hypothetical protein M3R35_04490 [Candidatus Eremiobacteraeota bacterium]|nr:hypothetical protein [Candidatus Eremiobacteraeota bacterium]
MIEYIRAGAAMACLALAATPVASTTATPPTIAAFDDAFANVRDYTATMTAHEVLDSKTQDRVYHYWFKRPHQAKIEIASGDGSGSGGVWNGGDRVSGHQGGFLISKIHLKVDLHDSRAVSLRGYTIPDGLFANEVDKYREIKGTLTQRQGPAVNGEGTDEVELKVADPASNAGVTRMLIDLSQKTHMPARQLRFAGDRKVSEEIWSDIHLDAGLTDRDFPF